MAYSNHIAGWIKRHGQKAYNELQAMRAGLIPFPLSEHLQAEARELDEDIAAADEALAEAQDEGTDISELRQEVRSAIRESHRSWR